MRRTEALRALTAAFWLLAGPVAAETLVDAYGLGAHAPRPEEWTKIDEDLSVRARIVDDATGKLAPEARAGQRLRLDLAFHARPGAQDRGISLLCSLRFYDAAGEASNFEQKNRPCYTGRLADGLERFQPLDFELRFRPVSTDPEGTAAVEVRVEEVGGSGVTLHPTWMRTGG